jgi:hypothetical protein
MAFIPFLFLLARLPAHSETLKISATGRSFTQLPIRIAQVKGFYRDEEPEVVYVQMTGQLATASLFGGHVDATTAFSASATGDTKEPTDSKLRPRIIEPHQIQSRHPPCPPFGARLAHDVMRTIGTTSLILRQS